MSADRWIQIGLAVVVAVLGAALWWGKRERDAGNKDAVVANLSETISNAIELAIAPLRAEVRGLATAVGEMRDRAKKDDSERIRIAREEGRKEAEFRQVKDQVEELDEEVDELGNRVSTVEGRLDRRKP